MQVQTYTILVNENKQYMLSLDSSVFATLEHLVAHFHASTSLEILCAFVKCSTASFSYNTVYLITCFTTSFCWSWVIVQAAETSFQLHFATQLLSVTRAINSESIFDLAPPITLVIFIGSWLSSLLVVPYFIKIECLFLVSHRCGHVLFFLKPQFICLVYILFCPDADENVSMQP
jgi:hypothetical protein